MNFEELKKAAKEDTSPDIKETQSLIIVTTEDIGPKISVQHATIGTAMHLAQALRSILKGNPAIAQCFAIISMQEMDEVAEKIKNEKKQAKYN
jgi:SepF-like predicted cell division protein (DUF552 family)